MPGQFLSAAERERLERFPPDIVEDDLNTFFTLSSSDIAQLPVQSAPPHRPGFSVDAVWHAGSYPHGPLPARHGVPGVSQSGARRAAESRSLARRTGARTWASRSNGVKSNDPSLLGTFYDATG